MVNTIGYRMNRFLEKWVPERRLFLRTDSETRFVLLRPSTQIFGVLGIALLIGWSMISTAILMLDSIGSGNFRDQALRDQRIYEERLNALAEERDSRAVEAVAAQERFNTVLSQVSVMQSELLASEERRQELETGIDVIQSSLRNTKAERDAAQSELTTLTSTLTSNNGVTDTATATQADEMSNTLSLVAKALADTAQERDALNEHANEAIAMANDREVELQVLEDKNDAIFRQLEDAMTISVKPLDQMFRNAGLDTDRLLKEVRRGYSGQGGPLTPLSISTKGTGPDADALRANRILGDLDRMNVYRIAAEKGPFDIPVKSSFRYTSGFGPRWGRMHKGLDFAAPQGTPILATGDGVVTKADWGSGYGRVVYIQHAFGLETRYAHMSKIRVKVGQRVSRGQRIGDMGNSGRSTGTHLHYEVRVGGTAVNPMTYIRAGQDVF